MFGYALIESQGRGVGTWWRGTDERRMPMSRCSLMLGMTTRLPLCIFLKFSVVKIFLKGPTCEMTGSRSGAGKVQE